MTLFRLNTFTFQSQKLNVCLSMHECFSRTLVNVFRTKFRPSTHLPEFLLPVVANPPCRKSNFSSAKQPPLIWVKKDRKKAVGTHQPSLTLDTSVSQTPSQTAPERLGDDTEGALFSQEVGRMSQSAVRLATTLLHKQDTGKDLLYYLGFESWERGVSIVKKLLEELPEDVQPIKLMQNISWNTPGSLDEASANPIWASIQDEADVSVGQTFDAIIDSWNPTVAEHGLRKRTLGLILKSLGKLILESSRGIKERDTLLPYILQILSHLHHAGVIPDSVYSYYKSVDKTALSQPPLLHLLSSQILNSLSDAAWKAHSARVARNTQAGNAQYFLGFEIPGSAFKVEVASLGVEVWLELVLWTCLHGGWIAEGASIINEMLTRYQEWSILTLDHNNGLVDLDLRRAEVDKTISCEILTAFVDALIDSVHVGVGARGLTAETVLQHLQVIKSALDQRNLGLVNTNWNAVLVRLLESEGVSIQEDPIKALEMARLTTVFGEELAYENQPLMLSAGPIYLHDPSAASIGFLHRAIEQFTKQTNIAGTLTAFEYLQRLTDINKQRAIASFVTLQDAKNGLTTSGVDSAEVTEIPLDFPGFFPLIPTHLLGDVLDLATDSAAYDFGNWLLYSNELDGPLIPELLYQDSAIGPALVRFGTLQGNKTLVERVLEIHQYSAIRHNTPVQSKIMYAFLQAQIENRRWRSVERILNQLLTRVPSFYNASLLSLFAKALIFQTKDIIMVNTDLVSVDDEAKDIATIFRNLIQRKYGLLSSPLPQQVNRILAILCTGDAKWKGFCSDLWVQGQTSSLLDFDVGAFNNILEAICEVHGSLAGYRLFRIWCTDIANPPSASRRTLDATKRIPLSKPSRAVNYDTEHPVIRLSHLDLPVSFRDRFRPDLSTIRIILRKALQEREDPSSIHEHRRELQKVVDWSQKAMRSLSLTKKEVHYELLAARKKIG
jgi:hypothetical protein